MSRNKHGISILFWSQNSNKSFFSIESPPWARLFMAAKCACGESLRLRSHRIKVCSMPLKNDPPFSPNGLHGAAVNLGPALAMKCKIVSKRLREHALAARCSREAGLTQPPTERYTLLRVVMQTSSYESTSWLTWAVSSSLTKPLRHK